MRLLDGITDSMDMLQQTSGDGEGQGNLACCSPQNRKGSDSTYRLNNKAGEERGEVFVGMEAGVGQEKLSQESLRAAETLHRPER